MGMSYAQQEMLQRQQAIEREIERRVQEQAKNDNRVNAAERIVMVLVDFINAKIIRPGPTSEERECYEMSQELRDIKPELVALTLGIFDQVKGVK